jgi:hypothetical protein
VNITDTQFTLLQCKNKEHLYRSEAVPWTDNTEIPTITYTSKNKSMVNEGAAPTKVGTYNVP